MQTEIEEVKHRSSKNRKRWCKGKVGRLHDWEYCYTFSLRSKRKEIGNNKFVSVMTGKCVNYYICANCQKVDYKTEDFNSVIHTKRYDYKRRKGTDSHFDKVIYTEIVSCADCQKAYAPNTFISFESKWLCLDCFLQNYTAKTERYGILR